MLLAREEVLCKDADEGDVSAVKVLVGAYESDEALFARLPPLPEPRSHVKRWQATGGCVLVGALTLFFVAVGHAVSQASGVEEWYLPVILVWVEAALAFVCLFCILACDPGVVPRSLEHSTPLPPAIREKLLNGEGFAGVANVRDGERVFCVRCFVWRPATPPPKPLRGCLGLKVDCSAKPVHHCSICQRCVTDFDHHCGVFGRCIASGNVLYFRGIIAVGYVGMLTCGASIISIAILRWGWQGGVVASAAFLLSLAAIYKGGLRAMMLLGNGPRSRSGARASSLSCPRVGMILRRWHTHSTHPFKSSGVTLQGSQST